MEAEKAEILNISIHAPRKGERPATNVTDWDIIRYFNPRSPQGGATYAVADYNNRRCGISIHAPRKGERRRHIVKNACITPKFQSTLPARGSDAGI